MRPMNNSKNKLNSKEATQYKLIPNTTLTYPPKVQNFVYSLLKYLTNMGQSTAEEVESGPTM